MSQLACCPRCGLSMQVLDLGMGGPPLCPSCACAMEEVPDADLVAEGPPAEPARRPLSPGWQGVGRGLALVQLGLLVFFGGWGLAVMAAFALVVFSLVD